MLEKFPTGMLAVVSDSYDIWNACEKYWGEELKDLVVKRGENNGCLIVRPDSGDPPKVVVQVSLAFFKVNIRATPWCQGEISNYFHVNHLLDWHSFMRAGNFYSSLP
jgi:nicotinic acid phosphoribosyltransferase